MGLRRGGETCRERSRGWSPSRSGTQGLGGALGMGAALGRMSPSRGSGSQPPTEGGDSVMGMGKSEAVL